MSAPNSPFLLPINQSFSDDWKEFLIQFTKLYADISRNTNARDIAIYDLVEVTTGQQWYVTGSPQTKRSGFRKTVQIPALVLGLNSIAHGIAVGTPSTYVFTPSNGMIFNQALPKFVPIPNDDIHVDIDATNVNITIPAAYVGYTGNMVLEYLKTNT